MITINKKHNIKRRVHVSSVDGSFQVYLINNMSLYSINQEPLASARDIQMMMITITTMTKHLGLETSRWMQRRSKPRQESADFTTFTPRMGIV